MFIVERSSLLTVLAASSGYAVCMTAKSMVCAERCLGSSTPATMLLVTDRGSQF